MSTVDEYLETRVLTAPPAQLHLLVLDAAIRYAQVGQSALTRRDFGASHQALSRSRACVSELLGSLNADVWPDLVAQLKQLFLYAHRQLTKADLTQNADTVSGALRVLELHRETWQELLGQLAQGDAAATPCAAPPVVPVPWSADDNHTVRRFDAVL